MGNITLDWKEYEKVARQVVAEGCVLLENTGILPLKKESKVALFGRIQNHYYKSGTGSGGMVNVSEVVGIKEALEACDSICLDRELIDIYEKWEIENPYDEGIGWGNEPWSQPEMELSKDLVEACAKRNDVAVVIIGRTAGEDKDASDTPGSYRLSEKEEAMLQLIREAFDNMIVLFNIGGLMDFSLIDAYAPEAAMIVWTGGMVGGLGVVDVLTGEVSPSGHLTDTVSYEIEDHYADKNFGNDHKDFYEEDIYVGYRYFETFAKDCVRYPFGYGLSYTKFSLDPVFCEFDPMDKVLRASVKVTNVGAYEGKAVVQFYVEAPQGVLGKAKRVLAGFGKTQTLKYTSDNTEEVFSQITCVSDAKNFASYDDSGITGYRSYFVLEAGEYVIYAGENVRDAFPIGSFTIDDTMVLEQLEEALAPVEPFLRLQPYVQGEEICENLKDVPVAFVDMDDRRKERLPKELTAENALEEAEKIVLTMSDNDLTCIIRGEGMGSSRVTPGTASAFGGVSDSLLKDRNIPAICCSDGPSGMRLDCGTKAFSLPSGILQGSTFHPELIKELYSYTGKEMLANKVDCLLGPGMNIHRHPLNGRNFEYFSEDPLLTGIMAGALVEGLQSQGVTGVCKHFCANNQEKARHTVDSIVSERALREIYLRGFEIAVRDYGADAIMTTYGRVNGLWTAGSYDLNTTILRNQWGFRGVVMTDWWANINERGKEADKNNFGAMVRAQNDLYMVCPDGSRNAGGDNIEEALLKGWVTKGELQRSAVNIVEFALKTEAMRRKNGNPTVVTVLGKPVDEQEVSVDDVEFYQLDGSLSISLEGWESKGGSAFLIPLDVSKLGYYKVTVKGSSNLSELAQLPCTLLATGYPVASFTFRGSNGETQAQDRELLLWGRFNVMRLEVAKNGLELKEICFEFLPK